VNAFHLADVVTVFVVFVMGLVAVRSFAGSESGMPKEGQMAPSFTLPNESGTPVSLESYRGQWVVLYFYPKDRTTGCTIEARNFQRDLEKYEALHAVVVGVNLDTEESHGKFCAKDGLHFTLLSDHEAKVSKEYGVLGNIMGMKMDKRITFLIDPEGEIAKVWTGVNVMTHSQQVLAELHKLQA